MSDPCHRVISDLEIHPSRLNKEAIIQVQAEAGNNEFFHGLRLAFDAMTTFGIKQVKEKEDEDGPGLSWDDFVRTIDGFINRTVTGNSARDTIDSLMKTATKAEWNGWYRRILIKDMRAGFSENTVNKVVGKKYAQYAIPVFSCQLAHDSTNHETKVAGKKLIEVKLDGVRVLTIVYPDGRVDQFSRNGKELVNFPHVKEQFAKIATGLAEPWVFDGEIMSSSFQDLMKQIHRKGDSETGDAVLNLFDWLPLHAFEAEIFHQPQAWRSEALQEWHSAVKDLVPNITVLSNELVDLDTAEGYARFKAINQQAVLGGYEGIMIKDPEASYECKRSVAWLKLKPFIEVSLEVKSLEEGTGRNVGRLGALVCEGVDDGKSIKVNVGSGFSDTDRDNFWNSGSKVVGQIVEVRADAVTQNQDGSFSLRFPRFIKFRGFEVGEKL